MYNRYFAPEDYVSAEEERQTERTSDNSDSSPGSLLSALLGGTGDSPLSRLGLDSGDALVFLLLYCLYRETKDEEWLIILALMLFTGRWSPP